MEHIKYTEFYSEFADDYDLMTKDSSRWAKVHETYRNLFGDDLPESILDAGCGSGGEMIALSKLGLDCIGVDGSAEMIRLARLKAKSAESTAVFFVDDICRLTEIEDERVNLVICRGNTIPHIRTADDINSMFSACSRVTKSGGSLILQWLNYDRILKNKKRLIGVSGDRSDAFARFYDFKSEHEITFNLLILNYDDKWTNKWISTPLTPWTSNTIKDFLRKNDWQAIEIYGDLNRSDFVPEESNDIVVIAKKL